MYAKFTTSVKASKLIKSHMKLCNSGGIPAVRDSVVGDSVIRVVIVSVSVIKVPLQGMFYHQKLLYYFHCK